MLTAEQIADAEVRWGRLVAAVAAIEEETWPCLPAGARARMLAAMDWEKLGALHAINGGCEDGDAASAASGVSVEY
jgi:hypothetical protein